MSVGHNVIQHTGDADRMLNERAIRLATENNVYVLADGTDIFVILIDQIDTSCAHSTVNSPISGHSRGKKVSAN